MWMVYGMKERVVSFLRFVMLRYKKKDTWYWRMVVNKGDREEHVFIFVWFVVLVGKKDTCYYVCY